MKILNILFIVGVLFLSCDSEIKGVKDSVSNKVDLNNLNIQKITMGVQNGVSITQYKGTKKDLVLPSVINGQKVLTIGDGAFANKRLISVIIPDSVTTIGDGAFAKNKLTSVTIPDSVTTIRSGAFAQNQLTSVTIKRTYKTSLTKITSHTFDSTPLKDKNPNTKVTITVPRGLKSNYQTLWSSKIDADAGIKWKE